ncbi:hypothetical protein EYB31_26430 [Paenibacillus thalictri]|uniref:Uncharacterized protein n=2 Tax=Paenibacillus thalictri TaxID=2527873 RepID=A0A4Q9DLZ5_9BACL|nr:hypothetical protein EYB31_26430 [Paenibacillus thalictri]
MEYIPLDQHHVLKVVAGTQEDVWQGEVILLASGQREGTMLGTKLFQVPEQTNRELLCGMAQQALQAYREG